MSDFILKEVPCDECGGDGVVYWYDSPEFEEEEEECDVCKGSGILRIPVDEEGNEL